RAVPETAEAGALAGYGKRSCRPVAPLSRFRIRPLAPVGTRSATERATGRGTTSSTWGRRIYLKVCGERKASGARESRRESISGVPRLTHRRPSYWLVFRGVKGKRRFHSLATRAARRSARLVVREEFKGY